jgi:hypothetical protein
MFRRVSLCLLPLLCLLLLGCDESGTGFPALVQKPEVVKGSGTVVFSNVEGGCWTIISDTGNSYEPVGLSDSFKKDGLRVQFTLRTLDVATTCMVGVPVEVVDLQLLISP